MSRAITLSLGLLWILTAHATPPRWPTPQEFQRSTEQFTYDRLQDARRLMIGPRQPNVAPVAPNQTCAELYVQRLHLMQSQYDYAPTFSDDRRNQAATFLGAIFNPALFYLAFTSIQSYTHATAIHQTNAEIDALRYASAAQQCYVR